MHVNQIKATPTLTISWLLHRHRIRSQVAWLDRSPVLDLIRILAGLFIRPFLLCDGSVPFLTLAFLGRPMQPGRWLGKYLIIIHFKPCKVYYCMLHPQVNFLGFDQKLWNFLWTYFPAIALNPTRPMSHMSRPMSPMSCHVQCRLLYVMPNCRLSNVALKLPVRSKLYPKSSFFIYIIA